MIRRALYTKMSLLRPNVAIHVKSKQQEMCAQRSTPSRALAPVQSVMMRDFRVGKDIWIAGTISKRTGPVSYRVQVDPTTQWRRYTDQIVVLGYLSQIA